MKLSSSSVRRSQHAFRRNLIAAAAIVVLIGNQAKPMAAFAAAEVETSTPKARTVNEGLPPEPTLHTSQMGSAVPAKAAAQKAILYEEDLDNPPGAQYEGTVNWRLGSLPASSRQPEGLGILADVEMPERFRMTLSIRQNADVSLPASHVAELAFELPVGFSNGRILSVKGILMKAGERAKAIPLLAIAAKVRTNLFLIGLSNVEADRLRNVLLLKSHSWIDIAIVYENQHRAILALEKGKAGEHVFNEAFATWGQ
jgi:hypothetical protein